MSEPITITLPATTWRALCIAAAKKDPTRFYLEGVALDFRTRGRCHVVSTDGHRALIVGNAEVSAEGIERAAGRCFIVPRAALERVKSKHPVTIEIVPVEALGTFTVYGDVATTGKLIDSPYPDWLRMVPEKISGEIAQFNAEYIGDFGRIGELLGNKYGGVRAISHNGSSAAIIALTDDCFGLLIPVRSELPTIGAAGYPWLARA